jgi:hypothetical protein
MEASTMPERRNPSLAPDQQTKRRSGGQSGNRGARTHGADSAEEPATLIELHIPSSTEDDVPRRSSEYMILPERQIAVQPPSTVRA